MPKYANGAWTEGSIVRAAQGLRPRQAAIAEGTWLYRFIDLTKVPSKKGADGPWWFEFEHFQSIKSFSQRNGYSLGYAARLFAAILYEWSEVNAVVRAQVVNGPLLVWKGQGKQVSVSSDPNKRDARDVATPTGLITGRSADGTVPVKRKMTPTQGPLQVLQLYIPGLGWPHNKFNELMKLGRVEQIAHDDPKPG